MNPLAVLCAFGAIGFWSTNAVVAKHVLNSLSVAQVQTLQFAGASLAFWLLGHLLSKGTYRLPDKTALTLGLVGLVGTMVFQYIAFAIGPIATVNLLAYAWPLLTAVFVATTGGARHPFRLVLISTAGFCGVALLVGGTELSDLGGASLYGYLTAVASAICMATYSVGIGRVSASPSSLLLPTSILGLLGTGTWWLMTGGGLPTPELALMGLYLGAGPMGLGYALWSYAMKLGATGPISTLGYATPVFSTTLLIISGEQLTLTAFVGGGIIVVCCALAGRGQSTRRSSAKAARQGNETDGRNKWVKKEAR